MDPNVSRHYTNFSSNETLTADGFETREMAAYIVFFLASLVLATFVIVSNILFIIACSRTMALRTIANKHVHSLAVADMTLGAAIYAQGAFYINVRSGNVHSIEYPRLITAKKTTVSIIVAWAISILYGTIPLYNHHFSPESGCNPSSSTDRSFATSRLVLFVIASSISGFCHISIQWTAMKHLRKIYPVAHSKNGFSFTSLHLQSKHYVVSHGHMTATLKLVKTFFLVHVLFVYLWLPGLIAYTVGSNNRVLLSILAIMAELSTGLNVLVYVFSNRQFKGAILKVLGCSSPTNSPPCPSITASAVVY